MLTQVQLQIVENFLDCMAHQKKPCILDENETQVAEVRRSVQQMKTRKTSIAFTMFIKTSDN